MEWKAEMSLAEVTAPRLCVWTLKPGPSGEGCKSIGFTLLCFTYRHTHMYVHAQRACIQDCENTKEAPRL